MAQQAQPPVPDAAETTRITDVFAQALANHKVPLTFHCCRASQAEDVLPVERRDVTYYVRPSTADFAVKNDWKEVVQYLAHEWKIPYNSISELAWHNYSDGCDRLRPFADNVWEAMDFSNMDDEVSEGRPRPLKNGICLHIFREEEKVALVVFEGCAVHWKWGGMEKYHPLLDPRPLIELPQFAYPLRHDEKHDTLAVTAPLWQHRLGLAHHEVEKISWHWQGGEDEPGAFHCSNPLELDGRLARVPYHWTHFLHVHVKGAANERMERLYGKGGKVVERKGFEEKDGKKAGKRRKK